MNKRIFTLFAAMLLLLAACSQESRSAIADWFRQSGGPAAAEGAQVALTAAAEAAQTNVPRAQTAAAVAAGTGVPIARTLVAEGAPVVGTLSAEALATGGPLAGTAIAGGVSAISTRAAQEPGYRCPADTYTVDFDLTRPADISGAQLDAALAAVAPGSPLVGWGEAFVSAARAHGVNAYYVAAHAAWDSTWGTNPVATVKNNLLGYGATASCPFDCAVPFESQQASLDFILPLIKADYLTPGGRFYTTGTLAGMAPIYSGHPQWAEGIAAIMNLLRQNTPCP